MLEQSVKEKLIKLLHISAWSYRNSPRLDTTMMVDRSPLQRMLFSSLEKISDYKIPGPNEGPEPGARWTFMFDGDSNTRGHDIGEVLTSPKNSHKPYAKSMENGILNIQN